MVVTAHRDETDQMPFVSTVWEGLLSGYSPDLNPIEKMWSKIKAVLRALKARTSRALNAAIRKACRSVTPDDVLSWFASCGYTSN